MQRTKKTPKKRRPAAKTEHAKQVKRRKITRKHSSTKPVTTTVTTTTVTSTSDGVKTKTSTKSASTQLLVRFRDAVNAYQWILNSIPLNVIPASLSDVPDRLIPPTNASKVKELTEWLEWATRSIARLKSRQSLSGMTFIPQKHDTIFGNSSYVLAQRSASLRQQREIQRLKDKLARAKEEAELTSKKTVPEDDQKYSARDHVFHHGPSESSQARESAPATRDHVYHYGPIESSQPPESAPPPPPTGSLGRPHEKPEDYHGPAEPPPPSSESGSLDDSPDYVPPPEWTESYFPIQNRITRTLAVLTSGGRGHSAPNRQSLVTMAVKQYIEDVKSETLNDLLVEIERPEAEIAATMELQARMIELVTSNPDSTQEENEKKQQAIATLKKLIQDFYYIPNNPRSDHTPIGIGPIVIGIFQNLLLKQGALAPSLRKRYRSEVDDFAEVYNKLKGYWISFVAPNIVGASSQFPGEEFENPLYVLRNN